jgi:osmotically inducible protein OsmC
MNVLYTAVAHATGDGRNGHARTDDGVIDLDLRIPKELGGPGGATNPEQLFAAGYSACFHSALKLVAQQAGADTTGSEVSASVGLGTTDSGGFGLAVELDVLLPQVEREAAQSLVERAHQVCPYSNATRGNIDVSLNIVD